MTQVNRTPGAPLGEQNNFEDSKREAIRQDDKIDALGAGLQFSKVVKVPATGTTRVVHGLGSLPNSIGICPTGAPASLTFVLSKDRESVTVQNDDAVEVTVEVSVFG